jgi:hypothetical protein
MRHLTEHERGVIALALIQSAVRWADLGTRVQDISASVAAAAFRQSEHARRLSDAMIEAGGVVLL